MSTTTNRKINDQEFKIKFISSSLTRLYNWNKALLELTQIQSPVLFFFVFCFSIHLLLIAKLANCVQTLPGTVCFLHTNYFCPPPPPPVNPERQFILDIKQGPQKSQQQHHLVYLHPSLLSVGLSKSLKLCLPILGAVDHLMVKSWRMKSNSMLVYIPFTLMPSKKVWIYFSLVMDN